MLVHTSELKSLTFLGFKRSLLNTDQISENQIQWKGNWSRWRRKEDEFSIYLCCTSEFSDIIATGALEEFSKRVQLVVYQEDHELIRNPIVHTDTVRKQFVKPQNKEWRASNQID